MGLFAEWGRKKEPVQRVWMAQGWGVPAAGWGSVGAGLGMCAGSERAEELTNHPASLRGGSRGWSTGKPEHKNRGCTFSMVHLSDRP